MSLNKRISGNFNIESVNDLDEITIKSQTIRIQGRDGGVGINDVIIDGHLTVTGDTNTVTATNTEVVDNYMVLNSGEGNSLTGITSVIDGFDGAPSAGFIIDRGTDPGHPDVAIRFNETIDKWEATNDGTVWYALDAGTTGTADLVTDLSPQLGADLDVNGHSITSVSNGDIVIVADGTGLVKVDQDLSLKEQVTDETPEAGYNKVYAKVPGPGGSGLYVANDTTADELVTKKKAIVFGLIF